MSIPFYYGYSLYDNTPTAKQTLSWRLASVAYQLAEDSSLGTAQIEVSDFSRFKTKKHGEIVRMTWRQHGDCVESYSLQNEVRVKLLYVDLNG